MAARHSSLQAAIVKPEDALPIKAFGLDLSVLLTTEATGGTISVLIGSHKPGEGPHSFKNVGDTTARMLDWSLPGGQDHYFKAIAELAAGEGFTGA